jgi:hypothetical protein
MQRLRQRRGSHISDELDVVSVGVIAVHAFGRAVNDLVFVFVFEARR